MAFLQSIFVTIASLITGLFADKSAAIQRPVEARTVQQTLYDFKVKSLVGGQVVDLGKYKGKKVVILNVASKCGYTKQYADWEAFNKKYGNDVIVLGFPSNNFGGQEPGSAEEIATFCSKTYGVTFPMFEKVEVVGENQAPLYKWLSTKSMNGWNDQTPSWNFCKYVINEQGELTNFFASKVLPTDPEFLKSVNL
ncbi:glutathione peroxidase [Dyadobacter tibetensis]|uniref:glutathione peroxidase n=1 Tax=Dyadobacter tibetensis TaxID=1211851 RepID=UPI00046F8ED9|nr:glutathione peroxidase [Dyadobacter tibetensis]